MTRVPAWVVVLTALLAVSTGATHCTRRHRGWGGVRPVRPAPKLAPADRRLPRRARPLPARRLDRRLQAAIDKLGKLDYQTRVDASATLRRAPAAAVVPMLVDAARGHADGYVRFRALVLLSGFNDPKTRPRVPGSPWRRDDRLREVAYAYVEDTRTLRSRPGCCRRSSASRPNSSVPP